MYKKLRRFSIPVLFIIALLTGYYFYSYSPGNSKTPVIKNAKKAKLENEESDKGRAEYYFRMLRDPSTNSIPKNVRARELAFANNMITTQKLNSHLMFSNPRVAATADSFSWKAVGPDDIGGRTRALAVDVNNPDHIVAGGVSGGIWESKDAGKSWSLRNTPDQNLSVSYVAQDHQSGHTNIWYYSSGELVGNTASAPGGSAFYRGTGLFKSTDNGDTWKVIPVTQDSNYTTYNSPFQYVSKIAVSPTTGTLFVASFNFGILRSANGGQSFSQTLGKVNDHVFTGLAVNKNGLVLASLSADGYNKPPSTKSGLYISSDDGKTWKNITPSGFPSYYERTVMAFSPSDPNIAYTLTYDGSTSNHQSKVTFYKLTFKGDTLYSADNRSANIPNYGGKVGQFDVQQNYNMVVAVKPDNPNFVVIGATNLYRSNDGFSTTPSKSYGWIGGYDPANNITQYPNHHVDQHMVVFVPQHPNEVWNGNDGGVYFTSDITATSSFGGPVVWSNKNNGYITSQFYAIAMNSKSGDNRLLGGAQDNGSPFFVINNGSSNITSTDVSSGDGGFAYLGKSYAYTETQNGDISRHEYDSNGNLTQYTPIKDITPPNASNQLFVAPYAVDPNSENTMYYLAGDSLWRNTQLDISTPKDYWHLLNKIKGPSQYVLSAVNISHNPSHILYIGASSQNVQNNKVVGAPEVFRVNHSDTATVALNRSSTKFPDGGYINDIAINPTDADKILVIFSNYNVPSIFYSNDGGLTYTDVEGNLSAGSSGISPSIRSAAIIPTKNHTYYLIATSTGLYMTDSLNGSSTQWTKQANNLIGNAVVDWLDSRQSDDRVAVATHGRGVFIGSISNALPVQKPQPLPSQYKLAQNYPNPFNPSTVISYSLPVSSKVSITVYNVMGQEVAKLVSNQKESSGTHDFTFYANNLASGTYFYRMIAVPQNGNGGRFVKTKKMVYLK